jgi:hypothetical protein
MKASKRLSKRIRYETDPVYRANKAKHERERRARRRAERKAADVHPTEQVPTADQ